MKNILLTGSTGFIGSELLKYLSDYNKVYVIVRKKYKINSGQGNSRNLLISLGAIGVVAATMFFFLFLNKSEICLLISLTPH